ncbi:MAG: hypothetical protein VX000_01510, partial [Myxococcota bacterium]|nr:hypothetical protein [Myxococcota bacterium]
MHIGIIARVSDPWPPSQQALAPLRHLRTAAVGVLLLAVVIQAWSSHPAPQDDAFISFRYAANLLAGQGLVYNPGE